jgi:hypothetical protein
MGCVVKSAFETVFEALRIAFGNVYSKEFVETGETRIGIILGEKFFLRVKSDVAVLIVLKELSSDETNVEVISCAGGESLLRISYAAHPAYVHDVKNFLTNDVSGAVKKFPWRQKNVDTAEQNNREKAPAT